MRHLANQGALLMSSLALNGSASAGFVEYTNFAAWQSATAPYSTVDFVGLPQNTHLSTEYADLGVIFDSIDIDLVYISSGGLFPQDGAGMDGLCEVDLYLLQPTYSMAWHFPGGLKAWFYSGSTLLFTSSNFGSSGTDWFAGVVSDVPFDKVVVRDWLTPGGPGTCPPGFINNVLVDNIYFSTIPGPSGVVMLLAAGLPLRRRSR